MKTLKEINIEYPTLNTNGWGYVCEYTNKYITSKNVRSSTECNSCEKLMQYFHTQTTQQNSL